jgi:hypothetical protein
MSKHRKDDAKQRPAEPARQVALARELVPGGTTFAPGMPTRPVGGLTDAQGAPRQWSYPVGYNIVSRPRITEQTSFEQLRNLAALFDSIQLCEHALRKVPTLISCTAGGAPGSVAHMG